MCDHCLHLGTLGVFRRRWARWCLCALVVLIVERES